MTSEAESIIEGTAVEEEATVEDGSISFTVEKKAGVINVHAQGNNVNVDDIYGIVCILKRNIEAEQGAAMVQQAFAAIAQQQSQQAGQQGKTTESGLVVPR